MLFTYFSFFFLGGGGGVIKKEDKHNWLVVSTHLKNISQIGNLPQVGVKIKNIWNHHLDKGSSHPGTHKSSTILDHLKAVSHGCFEFFFVKDAISWHHSLNAAAVLIYIDSESSVLRDINLDPNMLAYQQFFFPRTHLISGSKRTC